MSTEPIAHSGAARPAEPRGPYRRWFVLGALLTAAGIGVSVAASAVIARHDVDDSRAAFERSSTEVAAALDLAVAREQDLVVGAAAFFLGNPDATTVEFREWMASVQALERYPELVGLGAVDLVPRDELPAFVEQVAADPLGPTATGMPFELVPPSDRDFVCLLRVGQNRDSTALTAPPGFDFCAGEQGALTLAARDSGTNGYRAVDTGDGTTLAVQVPYYDGGVVPGSVAARRAAFAGWMGMGFDPGVVLETALRDFPGAIVEFRFHDPTADVTFFSSEPPAGAESTSIDLENGWTVRAFRDAPSASLFAQRTAVAMLVAGVIASILIGLVVVVLGTSRARAMRLVVERTGELRHQALHDPLTDLPNRALIADRSDQLLARNRRHRTDGAALFLDLDGFKNVNDTLGHDVGDRLLIAVAERLTAALRDADTVGRMGGDEFVVLLDGGQPSEGPELVAQRLLEVMRQPFEVAGAPLPLLMHTSIGIAVGDRPTGNDLLRDADLALYEAKAAGRDRFAVFHPDMQTGISRRVEIEFHLRSALEEGQFRLVYQPIYHLEDLTLVGVEALLRWDQPLFALGGKPVEPDEFVPVLEQTGQIGDVGRWVLAEACQQMAEWHRRGDVLDVSVNVSARQLDNDDLITHIREALTSSGLPPSALIIELTETALMRNVAATARRLHAIRDLGVRIAVDDFGTGYSSLAYLQQFPVDCLKIDRRFTNAISTSPESKALIGTLVQLGKDLGLTTLAEGVETTAEMDHLRGEHVTQAQGFLLSRPLDAERFERELLAPARPSTDPAGRQ